MFPSYRREQRRPYLSSGIPELPQEAVRADRQIDSGLHTDLPADRQQLERQD
jgi:hypothetical protein